MATPSKVHLSLATRGEYHRPGTTSESAAKASELLQENHENHHIFFNRDQFHNHIAHHILTLFALGANPSQLQSQYDLNKTYQRPPEELEPSIVDQMHDPLRYKTYLGKEQYYRDFLIFFQQEMEAKGWESVVNEYVFQRDERADDMLVRLFAGFLHPIIHLGFGIEFQQPAIVAEALAQAAVHDVWMKPLFLKSEQLAHAQVGPGKSLLSLLQEIRKDENLQDAPRWSDGNKLRDGVLGRAGDEMIRYASQWTVGPEQLDEKMAEMTNFCLYFTAAAQRPSKAIKYDFFYMHCVNCSIFYSAFFKQPWITEANKIRLLEWKGRNDLAMYVSRHSPALPLDEITQYKPERPQQSTWDDIWDRVIKHDDDGHAAKLLRAIAHAQVICQPYETGTHQEDFILKGPDTYLKLAQMAIDSVDGYAKDPSWVRSAGFDEAWESIADRQEVTAH